MPGLQQHYLNYLAATKKPNSEFNYKRWLAEMCRKFDCEVDDIAACLNPPVRKTLER